MNCGGLTTYGYNRSWQQRYVVYADLHVNKYFRFFIEPQSGQEVYYQTSGPSPARDDFDILSAFADINLLPATKIENEPQVRLRIGRQEMQYGVGRLVSPQGGPIVRFGFDGVRLIDKRNDWQIDIFAARPSRINPGILDDGTNWSQLFWGLNASINATTYTILDFYYFGIDRANVTFDKGSGHEIRHTLGLLARVNDEQISGDIEAIYQFGSFWSWKNQCLFDDC